MWRSTAKLTAAVRSPRGRAISRMRPTLTIWRRARFTAMSTKSASSSGSGSRGQIMFLISTPLGAHSAGPTTMPARWDLPKGMITRCPGERGGKWEGRP